MKYIFHLFSFLILLQVCEPAKAQFWKKKDHYTEASNGKITEPDGNIYRDAFVRKSSKGPNIKTSRGPFLKTKKSLFKHSTNRKTKKPGSQKFFKPKYSKARVSKKSGDNFSRNARKTKKDAQKGGGSSKGIFKGRKK